MAPEQVEVGHQGLGIDVVGVLRCGRARLGEVDPVGALEQPGHREPGGCLGVSGVGRDQLLVLGDRTVDVTALEGVLGRDVPRVELLLAGLLVDLAAAASAAGGAR